jgi:hypothetical protein
MWSRSSFSGPSEVSKVADLFPRIHSPCCGQAAEAMFALCHSALGGNLLDKETISDALSRLLAEDHNTKSEVFPSGTNSQLMNHLGDAFTSGCNKFGGVGLYIIGGSLGQPALSSCPLQMKGYSFAVPPTPTMMTDTYTDTFFLRIGSRNSVEENGKYSAPL